MNFADTKIPSFDQFDIVFSAGSGEQMDGTRNIKISNAGLDGRDGLRGGANAEPLFLFPADNREREFQQTRIV